jgi:hypothetical protein
MIPKIVHRAPCPSPFCNGEVTMREGWRNICLTCGNDYGHPLPRVDGKIKLNVNWDRPIICITVWAKFEVLEQMVAEYIDIQ